MTTTTEPTKPGACLRMALWCPSQDVRLVADRTHKLFSVSEDGTVHHVDDWQALFLVSRAFAPHACPEWHDYTLSDALVRLGVAMKVAAEGGRR